MKDTGFPAHHFPRGPGKGMISTMTTTVEEVFIFNDETNIHNAKPLLDN